MSGLRHRLVGGAGAQVYAQILQVVVRLGEVPLFLTIWSAPTYGKWLVLAAIPSFLTFADGGFATTSARDMMIRLAAGDSAGARGVFQTAQALLLAIAALATGVAALVLNFAPAVALVDAHDSGGARAALLILVVYVLAGFQTSLFYGVYCAQQRYARGTLIGSTFLLVDLLCAGLGAWVFDSFGAAAAGMLISRLAMLAVYAVDLRKLAPWCRSGLRQASLAQVRTMALPALGAMAIPLGLGGNLSGMRIAVGLVLGTAAVPAFSAMRTLARTAQTPMLFIIRILEPELAIAFGAGDGAAIRNLVVAACQLAVVCGVVVSALMLGLARTVFALWVHRQFALDRPGFVLLLAASALNALWYTALQVAYATNRMHTLAVPFVLVYGLGGVALGVVLMRGFGLAGAAGALVAVEVVMLAIVLPQCWRLCGMRGGEFWRAMLIPRFAAIAAIETNGGGGQGASVVTGEQVAP
jgi:O-antigen/teichoic acid export membrane protein